MQVVGDAKRLVTAAKVPRSKIMTYTFSSLPWLQNFDVWGLNRNWIWISTDAEMVSRYPQMVSYMASPSYSPRKGM